MAVKYSIETMKVGFGTEKKEAYVGRVQLGDTVDDEDDEDDEESGGSSSGDEGQDFT